MPLNLIDLRTNAGTLVPGSRHQMMRIATDSGRTGMNTVTAAITMLVKLSIKKLLPSAKTSGSKIAKLSTLL